MPESSPNYLSTDAQGNVSAQFTGGLDLVTGLAAVPPAPALPAKTIRWHRGTAAGVITDYVAASEDAGATTNALALVANANRDRGTGELLLTAQDNGAGNDASVAMFGNASTSVARVQAQAGGVIRRLAGADGKAGFVGNGFNPSALYVFAIEITPAGTISAISDPLGSGFIFTGHPSLGNYSITFPTSVLPFLSLMPISPANGIGVNSRTANTINYFTHSNGSLVDAGATGLLTLLQ